MPKKFVVFSIFFLALFGLKAQNGVDAGISIGSNFSTLAGFPNPFNLNSTQPGIQAGIFYSNDLVKNFRYEASAHYSMKGSRFDFENSREGIRQNTSKNRWDLRYIDLHLSVLTPSFKNFEFKLGAYGAYLQSGRELGEFLTIYDNGQQHGGDYVRDLNDGFSKFDYGCVAALRYQFPFQLHTGIEYQHGIPNLRKNPNTDDFAKNRTLSICVGYSFF